jgi:hypothetical protein
MSFSFVCRTAFAALLPFPTLSVAKSLEGTSWLISPDFCSMTMEITSNPACRLQWTASMLMFCHSIASKQNPAFRHSPQELLSRGSKKLHSPLLLQEEFTGSLANL